MNRPEQDHGTKMHALSCRVGDLGDFLWVCLGGVCRLHPSVGFMVKKHEHRCGFLRAAVGLLKVFQMHWGREEEAPGSKLV